jgi:hypothetical protein
MSDTTYIVLRAHSSAADEEITWAYHTNTVAASAEAAIRAAVSEAGTYVAVPERSWKLVHVTTETKTVLKLEQPSA